MFHYLFTNDLRITRLNEALVEAGACFKNGTVPSAAEDKNANNNMNTLGFYFNLTSTSNCAVASSEGEIRKVVLNFIKKFQFPNPRTSASLNDTVTDGITLAPMRIILQILYMMKMMDADNAKLSRKEVAEFIFFNEDIAKTRTPNTAILARQILDARDENYNEDIPDDDSLQSRGFYWKQCKRQIREMVKILCWTGCVVENDDGTIQIKHDDLSRENEADLFEILTYNGFWLPPETDDFNQKKESYQSYMDIDYVSTDDNQGHTVTDIELTPEWFRSKAQELEGFDETVQPLYDAFKEKYAPDKLQELNGKDVLATVFLNPYNKDNICRIMEYDKDNRLYFGSIKNGNAFKYGLFYSPKEKSWLTGTLHNPEVLDEDEAISIGEEIRDYLVNGAKVLEEYTSLDSIDEFGEVYEKLVDATGGYIKKVWFLKYYHMIFPGVFPPIYSETAQNTALKTIGISPDSTSFGRLGQLEMFVKECGISNAMFNHIMWYYAVNENLSEDGNVEEKSNMKNCLEITRQPRTHKVHPINFIVYGAPGTGKTYSMVEYALAIVDNVTIEEFREKNKDRKANVNRYKDLVKAGQVVFTTFHQNYGYEEFIQGLRPDKDSETMAFKTVDGVFKTIADTALNDTEDKNYIIIIDEINRANISKVFGELITLIEEDKRWGETNETSVTLQSGDPFAVPNNLYIVGTMNSADKSISLIDAALRRRFDFVEQKPEAGLVENTVLRSILENINLSLVQELDSTDLLVGHSYFMHKEEKDLCNILNNNIIPLLYEYFYDNRKKVANLLNDAIQKANAKVVIVDEKVGRLRVKDKVD